MRTMAESRSGAYSAPVTVARALVIDDDEDDRASVRMHLEDYGVDVLAPDRQYANVEELADYAVAQQVDVTICDHRLQPRQLAPFFGAEAVAELVKRSHVAVLVTGYFDMDFDTSIRQYRAHIPALLEREQLQEPDLLQQTVDTVQREIGGDISAARRLHRTIVRVGDIANENSAPVLDVFIPGWRPSQAVRMPAAVLPEHLAVDIRRLRGRHLVAQVNVGALRKEDVFFGAVEDVVEPKDWPVTNWGEGASLPEGDGLPAGLFEES